MDGYLLDTCVFSHLYNPEKEFHEKTQAFLHSIPEGAPRWLSVISLAELRFGVRMAEVCGHRRLDQARATLNAAADMPLLQVSRHTADACSVIRQMLASTYFKNGGCTKPPRWVEDWVDRASGKRLQVDENNVWLCALAIERNLVLVTTDRRMMRIPQALPEKLRVHLIR